MKVKSHPCHFFTYLGHDSAESSATASLYITLKDHKDQEAIRLLALSRLGAVRKAAEDQGYSMEYVSTNQTCKPVHLVLTERLASSIRDKLIDGVKKIQFTGIEINLVNKLSDNSLGKC